MVGPWDADACFTWSKCKQKLFRSFNNFLKPRIPNHIAMIQRNLYRASRHIAPRLSQRTLITPPRQSPAFIRLPALQPSSSRLSSRWYSDAAETKTTPTENGEAGDASKSSESSASPLEVQTLKAELESKNKEIIDLKVPPSPRHKLYPSNNHQDKYLRAVADYRNLQDRTKREVQSARDFALQNFAKDLIASIDNLEHALLSVPSERLSAPPPSPQDTASPDILSTIHKDLVSLHKGLQLTETVLMETLKRHGVTRFDPAAAGERFDPNVHEAVFQAPVPGKEEGTVFHTQQKGFMLNGRVIRAPKVGVVKNQ